MKSEGGSLTAEPQTFAFLLRPHLLASKNRARRSDRSDYARLAMFGSIGVAVFAALFGGAYWLTARLLSYAYGYSSWDSSWASRTWNVRRPTTAWPPTEPSSG